MDAHAEKEMCVEVGASAVYLENVVVEAASGIVNVDAVHLSE